MQEKEMTFDQFVAKYPAAAVRRNVKGCRYFEGGELAQPRDDRDEHEIRIVEHTAMEGGLTLEWATLDRDLLNGHRLQVSSYRMTDAPRPAAASANTHPEFAEGQHAHLDF